ncbi:MAG TPA: isoaspartyl peptidase/L-asparaginase, partial [Chitinophagaceae bacterium]|nr:isoaspartyl peptidase/L-asparaginase [Chitinophagaceae bacterium]
MQKLTLAIHGGAGTILKNDLTPELERLYNDGLKQALQSGYAVLEKNGTATDAVVAAVTSLENNILFNAGKGSVFTKNGEHEMDASIMEGKNLIAGAVAGVKNIKNPIQLAQKIMLHSNHVFLSGQGAFEFAQQQQLAVENEDYFYSEFRYKQWQAVKETDSYLLDHNSNETENLLKNKKFGTVGATACDAFGNLAAATST